MKECTYDSANMMDRVYQVGRAICILYHWIGLDIILYLVLDNTSVHVTNEFVSCYANNLKSEFSIKLIHQV